MHKDYRYASVFAELLKDYIAVRREAGFLYDNPAYWLYRFDQFCVKNDIKEAMISKPLFDSWASRTDRETKTTQNNRLQALRNFCVYLNTLGIDAYIPAVLPKTENIDLHNGIITICQSKGRKDRIVYLSNDLRVLCLDYRRWLDIQLGMPSKWFFPGKYPERPIPKTSVDRKFNEFWNNTLMAENCDKKPTVHCLRHAFVIKRINLWMETDVPLHVMMPYLSSYLGHSGPMETYYYFHQVRDAFQTVRRKDKISMRVIPEVQYES